MTDFRDVSRRSSPAFGGYVSPEEAERVKRCEAQQLSAYFILCSNPRVENAFPRFLSLEGLTVERVGALFELLELPISESGIETITQAAHEQISERALEQLVMGQVPGIAIKLSMFTEHLVGDGAISIQRSVALQCGEPSNCPSIGDVVFDSSNCEKGRVNCSFMVSPSRAHHLSHSDLWSDFASVLEALHVEASFEQLQSKTSMECISPLGERCVVSLVGDGVSVGMVPSSAHFRSCEKAKRQHGVETEQNPPNRPNPDVISLRNPSVDECAVMLEGLTECNVPLTSDGLSPFRQEDFLRFLQRVPSYLANPAQHDLETWELFSVQGKVGIRLVRELLIGRYGYQSSPSGDEIESWQQTDGDGFHDVLQEDVLPHRIEVRAVGANAREVVLELTREVGFLDEEDSAASNEEFVACLRFGSCMDEMSRWSVIKAVASAVGEGGAVSEQGLAEALQESGYVECGRLTLECPP